MKPVILSHIALLIVNIIYGLNYTIAKDLMPQHILPFGFVLMRVAGAAVLIWTLSLFYKEKIDKSDYKLFLFCALTGVILNQSLFFLGLSLTSPINASIIMISSPIFVVLFAAFLLKEKITLVKTSGIFLGLTGALILILIRSKSSVQSDLFGDICIFLNAVSYALYLVLVKPLMNKYHPITVMKWVFLFALPFIIPIGLTEFQKIEWEFFTPAMYGAVAFVVVATTFIAYLMSNYALRRVSPAIVGAYIYLQPLLATLISILQKKDSPDMIKIVAAILIFVGVYLVSKKTIALSKEPSKA